MLLEQADKAIDSVDQQVREEKQQVVQSQGNDRENEVVIAKQDSGGVVIATASNPTGEKYDCHNHDS